MVCPRCISTVEQILEKAGIHFEKVGLGEVELKKELPDPKKKILEKELLRSGFELLNDRSAILIDRIKKAVLKYISMLDEGRRVNLSEFIASAVNYEYSYISNLFSSIEGQTIEQYFILQRIEKVKELLVYDQESLSEIAMKLGYSSVHHLSAQFKKTTGLTPTHFKKIGATKRRSIDLL
jgi:AraC-like DNA-binding protein